ncbi:hypothetical protein AB0E69_23375 [Kribbella sp. NPDC026611]|uniref:hypothetical protein n=1 Tax=Kribbella sp. NPDC026611 TaxID=3154911 RepID=UPI0033CCD0AC
MPRKYRKKGRPIGKDRRFSIRSELRKQPDIQKIAKAVVALAIAQAEAEAEKQTEAAQTSKQERAQDGGPPDA